MRELSEDERGWIAAEYLKFFDSDGGTIDFAARIACHFIAIGRAEAAKGCADTCEQTAEIWSFREQANGMRIAAGAIRRQFEIES